MYDTVKENSGLIKLDNGSNPKGSNLPVYEKSSMNKFMKNIVFILDSMGVVDFIKSKFEVDENIFSLSLAHFNLKAHLICCEKGYKLLKNSFVEAEIRDSFLDYNYNSLIEDESLIKSEEKKALIATKDIYFNSPSAAACVAKERPANGRKDVRTSEWYDS